MRHLPEDNEVCVSVYLKSYLNAKNNMGGGKKGSLSPLTSNGRRDTMQIVYLKGKPISFLMQEGKGILLLPHYSSVTSSVWTPLSSCFVPRLTVSSGLTFALASHRCPDD